MEVDDRNFDEFKKRVVGRIITGIVREESTGDSFPQCANGVIIILNDGAKICFDGWGYDAWGLSTSYEFPMAPEQSTSSEAEPAS